MNSQRKNGKMALIFGLCWSILLIASTPAAAQTKNWNNLSGGNWMNSGNWSPSGVPGSFDDAYFDLSNSGLPYEVRLDVSRTIYTLNVLDDYLNLDLYGNTLTIQHPLGIWLGKDPGDGATLKIFNSQPGPGLLAGTTTLMLGWQAGSWGHLMLVGNNVDVPNLDTVWIGDYGDGDLEMSSGATMTSSSSIYIAAMAGSTSLVTVEGAGTLLQATDIGIGSGGSGVLNIAGGGVVTATNIIYTGPLASAWGDITVVGPNSALNTGDDFILNNGTLSISGGGAFNSSRDSVVGHEPTTDGTMTVSGATSQATIGGTLYVGKGGQGLLLVIDDADVTASYLRVGSDTTGLYSTGIGTVIVSGAGSTLITGTTYFSANLNGAGSLIVGDGGVVTTTNRARVYGQTALSSILTIQDPNSLWSIANDFDLGYWAGNSTLNILNGGEVTCQDLNLSRSSSATSAILVDGDQSLLECSGDMHVPGTAIQFYGGLASVMVSGPGLGGTNEGAAIRIGELLKMSENGYIQFGSNSATTIPSAPIVLSRGGNHFDIGVGAASGKIWMNQGGYINAFNACVGCNPGDIGEVYMYNGPGPSWISKYLSIGAGGTGTFIVMNDSNLSAVYIYVGEEPGSNGTLEVTWGGTCDSDSSMYIGASPAGPGGTGLLYMNSTSSVIVGDSLLLGPDGTINMSIAADITVGSTGPISGYLTVGSTGTLGGSGQVNANVYVTNNGNIAPGLSTGTLTLNQGLILDNLSKLEFELGTSGSDLLRITSGTYENYGSVEVTILDAGGLGEGQSYEIINWIGATPVGVDAADFVLVSSPINGTFSIVSSALVFETEILCLADTSGDGLVNVTDLLELLGAWGPNPGHPADINSDGTVNVTDLLALLAAWGPCL